jgi:hypothetical protein
MSLHHLCRSVTRGPVSVDLCGHFVNLLPLSELSLVHGQLFVVHGYMRPPNVFLSLISCVTPSFDATVGDSLSRACPLPDARVEMSWPGSGRNPTKLDWVSVQVTECDVFYARVEMSWPGLTQVQVRSEYSYRVALFAAFLWRLADLCSCCACLFSTDTVSWGSGYRRATEVQLRRCVRNHDVVFQCQAPKDVNACAFVFVYFFNILFHFCFCFTDCRRSNSDVVHADMAAAVADYVDDSNTQLITSSRRFAIVFSLTNFIFPPSLSFLLFFLL